MDELNVYQVFKNGNEFVMSNLDEEPCLRKCLSLARDSQVYVELWYVDGDGLKSLVKFWN